MLFLQVQESLSTDQLNIVYFTYVQSILEYMEFRRGRGFLTFTRVISCYPSIYYQINSSGTLKV